MSEHPTDPIDRRRFLKAAAATVAAGTALGAGAAFFVEQDAPVVTSVAPPPTAVPAVQAVAPAPVVAAANDTLAQLAAAQAENLRLRAEVDALQRRNTALEQSVSGNQDVSTTLQGELSSANERIGALSGLLLLYEQLNDVPLGELLSDGASRVGDVVDDLLGDLPSLDAGLLAGRQALDTFESEIAVVDAGRQWLAEHLDRVHGYYLTVENVLSEGVDRIGPFLEMLSEWFQNVLKWLPFGMGQTAAAIMGALTDLISETPFTISGAQTRVKQPLDAWLDARQGEVPLMAQVIRPIREQVIDSAESTATKARTVQQTVQNALLAPAQPALAQHNAVRSAIQTYRETHQI